MQAEKERTVPELVEYLLNRAERVVVGQSENIELLLLALIRGGKDQRARVIYNDCA